MGAMSIAAAAHGLEPAIVPGEIVVRFAAGASAMEQDRALARIGSAPRGRFDRRAIGRGRSALTRARTSLPIDEAIRRISADRAVAWAEPNFRCVAAAMPDDPAYLDGRLWGTYSDDSPMPHGPSGTTAAMGMQAEEIWAAGYVGDRSVIVAVIDEGVAVDHPDLAANTWTNPFDPPNGLDDDGNGFVDDTKGWDFLAGDASVYDGGATGLLDRHGTHVAGTIGAVGGNGMGSVGACWNVTLLPLKILGPAGGTTLDAANALDYLVDLKRRHGLNVVAANCSWTAGAYSRGLHEAVIRAARDGILLTCAAGNDGVDIDAQPTWPAAFDTTVGTLLEPPAAYDAVISIAALERTGGLASYSNHGAISVDLGAPGSTIYSTLPPSTYGNMSGTSMAAPHVAGAVALWASSRPGSPAALIRDAILGQARATPSLSGVTATGGRLDVSGFAGPRRDGALTSIVAPPSIMLGMVSPVAVIVENEGDVTSIVRVSLEDEAPAGGTPGVVGSARTVNLAPGERRSVTLAWYTGSASPGVHQLRALASPLAGEVDFADNDIVVPVLVHELPALKGGPF